MAHRAHCRDAGCVEFKMNVCGRRRSSSKVSSYYLISRKLQVGTEFTSPEWSSHWMYADKFAFSKLKMFWIYFVTCAIQPIHITRTEHASEYFTYKIFVIDKIKKKVEGRMIQSFLHIKLIIRRTESNIKIEQIREEDAIPSMWMNKRYKSQTVTYDGIEFWVWRKSRVTRANDGIDCQAINSFICKFISAGSCYMEIMVALVVTQSNARPTQLM